jgi:hypothetical protein
MPAPYYVSVRCGPSGGNPNKPHATFESALTEARRVHKVLKGQYLVRVFETAFDIDAETVSIDGSKLRLRTAYHKYRNPDGDKNAIPPQSPQKAAVVKVKRKKVILEAETEGA